MFDASVRRFIDLPLDAAARRLAAVGIGADQLTIAGAGFGIAAAVAIAAGVEIFGLGLFLAGRLLDGLDGAVARQTEPTDRGGFLDIALDFVVYAAIPLAFALRDPAANALAASCLLAGFLVNGAAFFAFAVMAARLKLETSTQGRKSLHYLSGLAEGSETIAFFAAFCIRPDWFAGLAYGFAALCLVSAVARIALAWRLLSAPADGHDG
jgi:phosphatidylglycerophosphate synthase